MAYKYRVKKYWVDGEYRFEPQRKDHIFDRWSTISTNTQQSYGTLEGAMGYIEYRIEKIEKSKLAKKLARDNKTEYIPYPIVEDEQ